MCPGRPVASTVPDSRAAFFPPPSIDLRIGHFAVLSTHRDHRWRRPLALPPVREVGCILNAPRWTPNCVREGVFFSNCLFEKASGESTSFKWFLTVCLVFWIIDLRCCGKGLLGRRNQVGRIKERSDAAPARRLTMPQQRCAWSGVLLSHCNLSARWSFCKRVFVSGGSDDFSRKRLPHSLPTSPENRRCCDPMRVAAMIFRNRFTTPNQRRRKIVGVALATRGSQPNKPPPEARPCATIVRAPSVATRTGTPSSSA